jgi:hypothetical protein
LSEESFTCPIGIPSKKIALSHSKATAYSVLKLGGDKSFLIAKNISHYEYI